MARSKTTTRRHLPQDLTGIRLGRLLVLSIATPSKTGRERWLCRCDCGKEITVQRCNLYCQSGCGCQRKSWNKEDLTGRRFGRLVVIGPTDHYVFASGRKVARWLCQCDCGNKSKAFAQCLKTGGTKSCGCGEQESRERPRKHGMTFTKEYKTWGQMKGRCNNPGHISYKWYGAKGITVCDRWLESFDNFYADMGPCPSPDACIDRIDNSKGYSKDNCRWSNPQEQANNRSTNRHVIHEGKSYTVAELSRKLGMSYYHVYRQFGLSKEKDGLADGTTTTQKSVSSSTNRSSTNA